MPGRQRSLAEERESRKSEKKTRVGWWGIGKERKRGRERAIVGGEREREERERERGVSNDGGGEGRGRGGMS